MRKHPGSFPKLSVDTIGKWVVSHAGATVLLQVIGKAGSRSDTGCGVGARA